MDREELLYWIWLAQAVGFGSAASDALISACSYDAKTVWEREDYSGFGFRGESVPRRLADKQLDAAEEIMRSCEQRGIGVLPCCVRDYYPSSLRHIKGRPVVLYYRGSLRRLEDAFTVAMVGTRRMTEYGRRTAYTLAYDLAKAGAVVVSGMALGIDGMAHAGALDAGGFTVAVLGCGPDRAYPPQHVELMARIERDGLLLSEYPPFTAPAARNFPARNRIISGLTQGTVVVEADLKSGALITARDAAEQGRRIFAVPGKAGESSSAGTNALIQNGACMVLTAEDVLREFGRAESVSRTAAAAGNARGTTGTRSVRVSADASSAASLVSAESGMPSPMRVENAPKSEGTAPARPETAVKKAEDRPIPPEKTGPAADAARKEAEDGCLREIGAPEKETPPAPSGPQIRLDEDSKRVYALLSFTAPLTTGELTEKGIDIRTVMKSLTRLEIGGYARMLPGGRFVKIR